MSVNSKKFKVVIAAPSVHNEQIKMLSSAGAQAKILPNPTEAELIEESRNASAIIVGIAKITDRIIKEAKQLKIIAKHGVGYDNIDVETATHRGILVTNTPTVNAQTVAEYTFGLILSLSRKITDAGAGMKSGGWRKEEYWGVELNGKIMGIIGFGHIGYKVAILAKGFGMDVLACDPYVSQNKASSLGVRLVNMDTLLAKSDVVSLHVDLNEQTKGLIGERELARMKKSAYLINVARGEVVDERALYEALKKGRIAGAALDVFKEEPPSDYSIAKLANILATPHIAGWTEEARRRMGVVAAEQVIMTLKGKRPTHAVNFPPDPEIKGQKKILS